MADKKGYANFYREASAILAGKKNAESGRPANGGIRGKLASAMYKGKDAERNAILRRFAVANGAPAAATLAAATAVASAAAGKKSASPITNRNRDAAKAALNKGLEKAGATRKASAAAAAKYAKLLKEGDKKGAKAFLKTLVEKATAAGAEAAAAAATKVAKANIGTNEQIANKLKRNLGTKGTRPTNIAKFRAEIAAGKTEAQAVAAVAKMRSNAATAAAATKKAKKAAKANNLEAVFKATGATGAAMVAPAKTVKKSLAKTAKKPKFNRTLNRLLVKKGPNYGATKNTTKKNDPFAGIYRPFAGNNNNNFPSPRSPKPTKAPPSSPASRRRTRRNRRN
jgi:hypothetical protein